jgi:hypothetical protein
METQFELDIAWQWLKAGEFYCDSKSLARKIRLSPGMRLSA